MLTLRLMNDDDNNPALKYVVCGYNDLLLFFSVVPDGNYITHSATSLAPTTATVQSEESCWMESVTDRKRQESGACWGSTDKKKKKKGNSTLGSRN